MTREESFSTPRSPIEVFAAVQRVALRTSWRILVPGPDPAVLRASRGVTFRTWKQDLVVRAVPATGVYGSFVTIRASSFQLVTWGALKQTVDEFRDAIVHY